MDDIDRAFDQTGQHVRHRVDAQCEPVASAGLDRDVSAYLVPAVCVRITGGKELHGVSAFLELRCEVRGIDDGAAGPGRQEGANLSDSHPIPPRRGRSEKWRSYRSSWYPCHSRSSHDSEPVGGLSCSVWMTCWIPPHQD